MVTMAARTVVGGGGVRQTAVPRFAALRGATTVEHDTPADLADAVREMLIELMTANGLVPEQLLSAIFSATPDIRCLYPAAIARELGWDDVPMLCVTEMAVDGALPRCVRVLLHLSVPDERRLLPCYMRDARTLRPDLTGGGGR